MPTGTRSSISANSANESQDSDGVGTHAGLLGRLDLGIVHQVRIENQPVGTDRDQQHRGDVRRPHATAKNGQVGMCMSKVRTLSL